MCLRRSTAERSRLTHPGELLRRYWQPVALSRDATSTPKVIRALGEELILFRDHSGRPGLAHPRCAHRGTSLYYGKVEEKGIRCCYHGWLFDVEGRCLEQPCEPEGGVHRDKVRQPWYPVRDAYDLVFAYMGPPEKMPILPDVEWSLTSLGVKSTQRRRLEDGKLFLRVTETIAPNVRSVPDAFGKNGPADRIEWTLPVDDTHFTTFTAGVVREDAKVIRERRVLHNGKLWEDMTEQERQAYPDDREAQVGQGPITLHSDEHLATSDKGLVMFRRLLQRQLASLQRGEDPSGVWFDAEQAVIRLEAGNFFDADANAVVAV